MTRRLKRLFWCSDSCYNQNVWDYCFEPDGAVKERLAGAYRDVTGDDIEVGVRIVK